MSKFTNDGLTRSGTGCFIQCSCTHIAAVGVKGLSNLISYLKWVLRVSVQLQCEACLAR